MSMIKHSGHRLSTNGFNPETMTWHCVDCNIDFGLSDDEHAEHERRIAETMEMYRIKNLRDRNRAVSGDNQAPMNNNHTPTPWHIHFFNGKAEIRGDKKLRMDGSFSSIHCATAVTRDDAEFIIRAVNSHEMLLQTLKMIRKLFKDGSLTRQMIDESIDKAKGR